MLHIKGTESEDERTEREYRDSIRAEPDWTDIQTSKAWLEERYPLLDDAGFGSPLFRYMKDCVKDPKVWRGRAPTFLASMLSFLEMMRFTGETSLTVGSDPKQEKLYPDYGYPRQEYAPEPDWTDIKASKAWLEQRYPLGRSKLGSPLLRYMRTCYAYRDSRCSPMEHLGSMLTEDEWNWFSRDCPASDRQRHHGDPDNVLYPEYDERMWPAEASIPKANEARPQSSAQRPRITSLPPPVAKPAMYSESYLPQLSTQTQSSSHSHKRKGNDRDDGPSEHPASKRRRKPLDLGEGVVMPAKPLNSYEDIDGPRKENDIRLMPPPPQPQQRAASVIRIGRQQHNKVGSSSSRQDTIGVTKTPPRPTPHVEENIDAKENPDAVDLESDVFGHRASAPSTKMPLVDHSRKRDVEDVSDEQSASSASKRRRTSPDTVGDSSPVSGPLMKRKRSIEDVEDAPPTMSSPKRQRTPPDSSGNESSPSSPFDPPEQSTPTPSPYSDNTPTENRIGGELPDPAPLHREYEDPTTVIFQPNTIEEESAFQSGSQFEVIDRRSNPATNPKPHLRDHEAALNSGSETQKSGMPSEPNLQDEDHIHVREDPDDMIIEPERPRNQRTTSFMQNSGNRTEQIAISVVIPLQTLQRQRAANEALPPDEATTQVPVIQKNRKRGRKPGTKGRKAPKSEPQLDQKKRKPPTNGRKNPQSKPERESQAYVGRLRSGVGGREHKKPSKFFMPP